jgi:hypothetical protein
MKRSVFFICAFIAALLPRAAQAQGPSIAFDEVSKDVKTVTDGETIQQIFRFTNKGDATLEILGINPSCGCTSTLLSASKIAPGKSGQLEVKIATKDMTALSTALAETVNISKTVTVTTNDPKQPQVILTITAVVAPEIVLSEPQIYFGSVAAGQEVTKDILVEISPDKPIKLLSATSTDNNVTVRLEPVPASSNKKVKIVAVQKATAGPGMHQGIILVKTSSPLKPEFKIPVRGIVRKSS